VKGIEECAGNERPTFNQEAKADIAKPRRAQRYIFFIFKKKIGWTPLPAILQ
jgi:hypothetical protein